MFEMSAKQQAAFKAAAGFSAIKLKLAILSIIAVCAVTWMIVVTVGLLSNKKTNTEDQLFSLGIASVILIVIGVIVYVT